MFGIFAFAWLWDRGLWLVYLQAWLWTNNLLWQIWVWRRKVYNDGHIISKLLINCEIRGILACIWRLLSFAKLYLINLPTLLLPLKNENYQENFLCYDSPSAVLLPMCRCKKRTMIYACAGDVGMMLVVFADRVAVLLGMINTSVPGPIMLVVNPVRYVSYSREINPLSEHHRWMVFCQIQGPLCSFTWVMPKYIWSNFISFQQHSNIYNRSINQKEFVLEQCRWSWTTLVERLSFDERIR